MALAIGVVALAKSVVAVDVTMPMVLAQGACHEVPYTQLDAMKPCMDLAEASMALDEGGTLGRSHRSSGDPLECASQVRAAPAPAAAKRK